MTGQRDVSLRERVLEAVTDSSLAELEFEKLLDVLLRRVRDLFAVDTATVLLLDAAGEHLVATATAGLEEEIFQGVRVPVGMGFAGRVAVRREPIVVDDVGPSTVVNPLLWEHGLRVLLGAPMIVGGQVNGVVHIGSKKPGRRFTDEDIAALQLVADRLALTAHAHRSRAERAAAALLQTSLLPAHLPVIPGWELAARYVSAESGVGGDWYDVFPLPDNRLGVVIGDVVGNGLAAAVVMGRLRSALRAYALEFPDPADVLGRLDRKASHFEHNTMATIGYAVIDSDGLHLRLALAGHLPPVLAVPGRPAVFTDVPVGPPVGQALAIHGRRSATVEVPVGALVALYTDGLVERRGQDIDARLARLLTAVAPGPPEVACARIMAEMVGARAATDDIALLAARHVPD